MLADRHCERIYFETNCENQLEIFTGQMYVRGRCGKELNFLIAEYTVMCRLSECQQRLYVALTDLLAVGSGEFHTLPIITLLKKLCNAPELLYRANV